MCPVETAGSPVSPWGVCRSWGPAWGQHSAGAHAACGRAGEGELGLGFDSIPRSPSEVGKAWLRSLGYVLPFCVRSGSEEARS